MRMCGLQDYESSPLKMRAFVVLSVRGRYWEEPQFGGQIMPSLVRWRGYAPSVHPDLLSSNCRQGLGRMVLGETRGPGCS